MRAKRRRARDKWERSIRNLPAVIPPPEEPKDRWGRPGRPTKFRPEYVEQARVLCEEGATDKEMAKFFDVNRSTINEWRFAHPEFAAVCKLGKQLADDRLERTAYELSMGYSVTVTETIKLRDAQGNEVMREIEVERYIPPNPDMVRWMLKNRRPDKWKDKTEQAVNGEIVHLTLDQAKERLKARLEQLKLGAGQPEG